MSKKNSPQDELTDMLKTYLDYNKEEKYPELEVRFGTRGFQKTTRIHYEQIIQNLLNHRFKVEGSQKYSLRIQNEYINLQTGRTDISPIRTEIEGLSNIQDYCKTNTITERKSQAYHFVKKEYFKIPGTETTTILKPVNFDDWNFRVTLQLEEKMAPTSGIIQTLLDTWKDSKKTFRLINRVTLVHEEYPLQVDMSIVRESHKKGYRYLPVYTMGESGVLENPEKYEVEIEVLKDKINKKGAYSSVANLDKLIKKVTKYILSGYQQTNYPVSLSEQEDILKNYLTLIHGKDFRRPRYLSSRYFIGPSSYTLQIQNIVPINEDISMPNIRNHYTVTDKADGTRKLLYIGHTGKLYLIDNNMNIQFTGAVSQNPQIYHSLLDGEHILHNKKGEFINLYAAFDIYYLQKIDIRSLGFVPTHEEQEKKEEEKEGKHYEYRLPQLAKVVEDSNLISIVKRNLTPLRLEMKKFYAASLSQTIFDGCDMILKQIDNGSYEYDTDGLIFTPMNMGVGSDKIGIPSKSYKTTWNYSFKWKPAHLNTIDFLITTKKLENGQDDIGTIFQNGKDTALVSQLTQYKTLILRVGFDEKKHGFINPCADIIADKLPNPEDVDNEDSYKPMPFYPTNPYDYEANICNILVREDGIGNKKIFTKEDEVIEDNTIVEFSYSATKEKKWQWSPLRVRYDKTAEYRSGQKNYGNAYHVANSNWHSLHNPITSDMIRTGKDIPEELENDEIYYNKIQGTKSLTRGLRDFHNLFVKKLLVMSISNRGDTLIDYAAGKGGDIPKWITAKLSFVFGIDIAKDNIENRLDGICARYLNYRKRFHRMPYALFLQGNTTVNIRNLDAFYTERGKQIARAIFGEGPKDEKILGKGVYRQYGKGSEGFQISSIQFAIHYMFESQNTLQNFLQNVSECTQKGGYFIGTCYDGKTVFQRLKQKNKGEGIFIMKEKEKMWELTKQYTRKEFPVDNTCVGYAIDVYQESINKKFREYLVNFEYLVQVLENYGFVLLNKQEYLEKELPASSGMFNELYGVMEGEIQRKKQRKMEYGQAPFMTPEEKQISFLNRYFIFKKVRNVDAKKVARILLGETPEGEAVLAKETHEAQSVVKAIEKEEKKKKARKIKKKLVLKD